MDIMKKKPDPRMHTAEHILNRAMLRMFTYGRHFISSNIEKKESKCDYRFDHSLSLYEIDEIQSRVNQVIKNDLPVTESFVSRSEAEKLYNTDTLEIEADGRVRIVRISEYDACPCNGDHVNTTGEIGSFRITTTSFEDGVLRIQFKLSA
jgi:misacylated tRNA(Ala) deacylase